MANDQEHVEPPSFGDDDENTTDDSMFVSAVSPGTVDISLSGADDDDEEESPFGAPSVRQKTTTNTTNTVESTVDDDDDDPFGTKQTSNNTQSSSVPAQVVPEPQSPTPKKQESHLYSPDSPQPTTTTLDSQISSSTPTSKSNAGEATTSKPVQKRSSEDTIEITVSDPAKVGDVSLMFILLIFISLLLLLLLF